LLIIHALLFIFLDQEKKPYVEKAVELKAQAENGEGSGVSPSSLLFSSLLCLSLPCWTWSCVSACYCYLKYISLFGVRLVMQENNVAKKKAKADDKDGDQEVDQPAKKRIRHKALDEDEDDAGDQEDEDEQNELDDDLDDDM
jgi:hypothetical protein